MTEAMKLMFKVILLICQILPSKSSMFPEGVNFCHGAFNSGAYFLETDLPWTEEEDAVRRKSSLCC